MTEALDAMISEAGGVPEAGGAGEGGSTEVSTVPAPLPDFVKAMAVPLVEVVGSIVCDAAHVTPLEDGEVDRLAAAVNEVLKYYLTIDRLDDKAGAWLALAAVGMGVATKRKRLPPKVDMEPMGAVLDAAAGT